MKTLVFLFVLVMNSAFATGVMSPEEQTAYVESVAKNLRKQLWRDGYENVETRVEQMTKEALDVYVKSDVNATYEEPLSREQISELYSCYFRKNCTLYRISVYSTMFGGDGSASHFVLVNPFFNNHKSIAHAVYVE